ncbi:MAG TPA: hypothetical protein PLN33_11205, partial [Hyphomonadaceae bacterium]|nr:hypothetical protein [Hyphomonadaceae bacterium]
MEKGAGRRFLGCDRAATALNVDFMEEIAGSVWVGCIGSSFQDPTFGFQQRFPTLEFFENLVRSLSIEARQYFFENDYLKHRFVDA